MVNFLLLLPLVTLLLLLPATSGLKCFTCMYDSLESTPAELASPTSAASHCRKDTLPIRLLQECPPPSAKGAMLCSNATLVEDSQVVSISRGCIEQVGGVAKGWTGGCELDTDDGFLLCLCLGDGCNVAKMDASYDEVVDKEVGGKKKRKMHNGHAVHGDDGGQSPRHHGGGKHHHHPKKNAAPGINRSLGHAFSLLLSTCAGGLIYSMIMFA